MSTKKTKIGPRIELIGFTDGMVEAFKEELLKAFPTPEEETKTFRCMKCDKLQSIRAGKWVRTRINGEMITCKVCRKCGAKKKAA